MEGLRVEVLNKKDYIYTKYSSSPRWMHLSSNFLKDAENVYLKAKKNFKFFYTPADLVEEARSIYKVKSYFLNEPSSLVLSTPSTGHTTAYIPKVIHKVNNLGDLIESSKPSWYFEDGSIYINNIDIAVFIKQASSGSISLTSERSDHEPLDNAPCILEDKFSNKKIIYQQDQNYTTLVPGSYSGWFKVSWRSKTLQSYIVSNIKAEVDSVSFPLELVYVDWELKELAESFGLVTPIDQNPETTRQRIRNYINSWKPGLNIYSSLGEVTTEWFSNYNSTAASSTIGDIEPIFQPYKQLKLDFVLEQSYSNDNYFVPVNDVTDNTAYIFSKEIFYKTVTITSTGFDFPQEKYFESINSKIGYMHSLNPTRSVVSSGGSDYSVYTYPQIKVNPNLDFWIMSKGEKPVLTSEKDYFKRWDRDKDSLGKSSSNFF